MDSNGSRTPREATGDNGRQRETTGDNGVLGFDSISDSKGFYWILKDSDGF